ncbi:MAG: Cdc6/Cdc18 family protein [Candidatus Woesearchaeota archaeon]
MGVFDKILSSDETLFKNEVSLSYDYIPKLIPYREKSQFAIARCIKPLFAEMNGKNAIIFGLPGVGKTVATKHILSEMEDQTDDIIPIYVNCWQKNTSYKIFLDICYQLDYKFTHNKRTEELFAVIKGIINKKSAVFVFDEIDKAEDQGFLYSILEEIYRKSLICITNYKSWISSMDKRIMSRFVPEKIEFLPYNKHETGEIIKERKDLAFRPNVWEDEAVNKVCEKTYELKDIRTGLFLLKESAFSAEEESRKKITKTDVDKATSKLHDFKTKKIDDLKGEEKSILDIIKDNSPARIGDLYNIYQKSGGKTSYKTFQRRIDKLQENNFIKVKKQVGGIEGTTTLVYYDTTVKNLNDFS